MFNFKFMCVFKSLLNLEENIGLSPLCRGSTAGVRKVKWVDLLGGNAANMYNVCARPVMRMAATCESTV